MAYMYQEEAGGGRGAELVERGWGLDQMFWRALGGCEGDSSAVWFRCIYDRNTIIINTVCNIETLIHLFI
jgi:hypothetical protein